MEKMFSLESSEHYLTLTKVNAANALCNN